MDSEKFNYLAVYTIPLLVYLKASDVIAQYWSCSSLQQIISN